MATTNNPFKPKSLPIRTGLFLGIAIQSMILIGLIQAHPVQSVQVPAVSSPNEAEPSVHSFSDWWINDDRVGMTDQIRHAKTISLYEPSAFKRISKIHQVLHGFHSGLPVEDEERLAELIYHESLRYGYDPELIVSVIMTESSFYRWAYSRKGAIGLMQIEPLTGQEMAEINQTPLRSAKALYDPHLNIKLGIQYLALLHQRFGDLGLALTAYNYGPTRVAESMDRGINLPPGYTQKILHQYKQLLHENATDGLPAADDRRS
ncbi:MAG: lytic transglycosylase domain-containing protein [Nitrospirae bacterium]|nr:lytic transglycosylase domain-containing protein [Nitrospirota bacterium]